MDEDEDPPSETSQPKCYLCTNVTPTIKCVDCSNLMFCETCDDSYHKYQRRQRHQRKPLAFQDGRSSPSAERKADVLSGQSQAMAQFPNLINRYPCGCPQMWYGPNQHGHLIPVARCLHHNPPNADTSSKSKLQNVFSADTTVATRSRCKGTEISDEGPGIDESFGTWVCEHCMFKNSLDKTICKLCCTAPGVHIEETTSATGNASRKFENVDKEDMPANNGGWFDHSSKIKGRSKNSTFENISKADYPRGDFWRNENDLRSTMADQQLFETYPPYRSGNERSKFYDIQMKRSSGITGPSTGKIHDFLEVGQDPIKTEANAPKDMGTKSKNVHNGSHTRNSGIVSIEKWVEMAEKRGFSSSDLKVAMTFDPNDPVQWLFDEWKQMIDGVVSAATNYGFDQPFNDVGMVSAQEAKIALYLHKNFNDAVVECIRRRKEGFEKLKRSDDFPTHKIVDALSKYKGDVPGAYEYLVNMFIKPASPNSDSTRENTSFQHHRDVLPSSASTSGHHPFTGKEHWIHSITSEKVIVDEVTCPTGTSGRQRPVDQVLPGSSVPEEKYYGAKMSTEGGTDEQLFYSVIETVKTVPELSDAMYKLPRLVSQRQSDNPPTAASPLKSRTNVDEARTVSRASAVKIDAKVEVSEADKKRNLQSRIQRFLAEGTLGNREMAAIASQLIDFNFDENDAIAAARHCSSVDAALTFLQLHECPVCMTEFCVGKMITMLNCEHRICVECTINHFSIIIKERNIMESTCPCCEEPNLNDDEVANQYFTNLLILLKNLIDVDDYKLFEQKLRDRALMLDPNFHWCQKCGSGFIAQNDQMKAVCPDCNAACCVKCNRKWESPHEGKSCEQFTQWKLDNDSEYQSAGLEKYLALYGIDCPKCNFRYELAKGGCLHFTCTQCRHQFCSGCGGTYLQAEACGVSPDCRKLGLHAHHPRSCLFYLRDWEPEVLVKLLDDNQVKYEVSRRGGDVVQFKTCPVLEQKEMLNGDMEDVVCGKEVGEKYSGLCKQHFVEYLVSVINKNGLDPANLMNTRQLKKEFKRNEKQCSKGNDNEEYRNTLRQSDGLSDQSQATAHFSLPSLGSRYSCGCPQMWFGPDEKYRLNPECPFHNPPKTDTSVNSKLQNVSSANSTFQNRFSANTTDDARSQSKGTEVSDEGPDANASVGKWVCEHCTFKNSLDITICKLCCKTPGVPAVKTVGNTSRKLKNVGEEDMSAKNDERAHHSSKPQGKSQNSTFENYSKDDHQRRSWGNEDPRSTNADEKHYGTNPSYRSGSERSKLYENQMKQNRGSTGPSTGNIHDIPEVGQDPLKTEDNTPKGNVAKFMDYLFPSKKQTSTGHANGKNEHNGGHKKNFKSVSVQKWVELAEKRGFSRSDLSVAMVFAPNEPVQWLVDEWKHLTDNVANVATNYGFDQSVNYVGLVSAKEAKSALYLHNNVEDAVDECIKRRMEGFEKLQECDDIPAHKILDALSKNEGDVRAAYEYLVNMFIKSESPNSDSTRENTSLKHQQDGWSSSASRPSHHPSTGSEGRIHSLTSEKVIAHDVTRPTGTSGRQRPVHQALTGSFEPVEKFYDAEMPTGGGTDEQLRNSMFEILQNDKEFSDVRNRLSRLVSERQSGIPQTASSPLKARNNVDEARTDCRAPAVKLYAKPEVSEADKKKRIRRFIADELVSTNQEAKVASFLMDLEFGEGDAIAAAKACDDVDMAIHFLQQLCEVCNKQVPMHRIFSMLNCPHRCCLDCARGHFKRVIEEGDILDAVCPVCHEPKLSDEQNAAYYFNNLEILLTNLLDNDMHDLLKEKLRKRSTIIDSKKSNPIENRIRHFLAEETLRNREMAVIASQLIDLNIDENDAIAAAKHCSSVDAALTFLQLHDCPVCMTDFCIGNMITMLNCAHRVCVECTVNHFSLIIKERNIMEATCPCCQEPNLNDDEVANQYFTNLQILLKNLIDVDVYKLFEQKLRDRALMLDPNFHWCRGCGSGFIAENNQMMAVCPDCKVAYCVKCNRQWESPHQGISCDQFTQWKLDNDPGYQSAGLEKYLAVYGIDCPKCKFRYDLAKGGCMHFTCSQCKHQFCSGCGGAYRKAENCRVSLNCRKLGLHTHHPRSCLFYLRDWEPEHLLKLLDDNKVKYEVSSGEGDVQQSKTCPVLEQKEMPNSAMQDAVCGKEVGEKYSGLCRFHFVEYLVSVINKNGLDPVNLMNFRELKQELRRNEKQFSEGDNTEEYCNALKQLILKEIPLPSTSV